MSSRRLKYLIKSKSFKFTKDLKDKSHSLNSIIWNDREVFYRTSSSDMTLIYEILLKTKYKSEYFFPTEINPKVIFDIGGNIGITAVFMARLFPNAKIFSFEPMYENYEILLKNTKYYHNIKCFIFGLGSINGNFKVYLSEDSDNFGGISFYPDSKGNKIEPYVDCKVVNVNDIIKELNLDSIDLIKIDTEGAEYDILHALKQKILSKTLWITGELHGNKDFELLSYLNSLGFSISLNKKIDNRLFMFNAGKHEIISQLDRRARKAL